MAAPKEAIALVIDIGAAMGHGGEDGRGDLETSLKAVNMIIQKRIFSKSKDEVALILFGTDGTENDLHESSGGYEHVSVVRELGPPDLELLTLVNKSINQSTSEGDFVDALVVAMDHLMSKTKGKKLEMRVILFTNLASPFEVDQVETIAKSMKANNIQLTFVGPDLEEDKDQDDDMRNDEDEPPNTRERLQGPRLKPLTPQQIKGVNCINYILGEMNGDGIPLSEVLPMLSFFQLRSVKQTTVFRGPLEIGNSLKINVYGYCKVKEAKPSSWKKLSAVAEASANPQTMAVSIQRSYHLPDEDQTEIDKENVVKAYKYGKSLVPMSKVDQDNMKLETEKCLSVLGFTHQSNINRGHYMGDSVYIFAPQPGDTIAARALSAVVHALEEKNMVAIARYCFRRNAAPKLGILIPHIKNEYEVLYFIQMPYLEDLRQFQFPSLDNNVKATPSEEQLQAMDRLIDVMDLTNSHITPDGEQTEGFKVRKTVNPQIQRQCQCIQHRALNPDEETLPSVEEYIKRLLQPSEEMNNRCQNMLSKMKEMFSLEELEISTKSNQAASNFFGTTGAEDKNENDTKIITANESSFSLSSIDQSGIVEIGTADPVRDFKVLLSRQGENKFQEAASGLQQRILQLVNDSFLNQNYGKALQCLRAYRDESIKAQKSTLFNDFLDEIKQTMVGQRRDDFYQEIFREKFFPINSSECNDSTVTEEDARKFFTIADPLKEEKTQDDQMQDADDLLDLM